MEQWLGIEIRHLAALRAIADEGSFHRAAARLGYSQPAISQQLASLERIVGRKLITRPRGSQPLVLTDAGALLVEHAAAIEGHLAAARADLAALNGGPPTLSVGTYQSVAIRLLPGVLRRFGEEFPQFDITLVDSAADSDLLGLLERGEIDLAFVCLPLPGGPFDAEPLVIDDYVLVVHEASALAQRDTRVTLEDLSEIPLVTFKTARSAERVLSHLRQEGHEPRLAFRSDDNAVVHGLVVAGLGAALVPRMAVDPTAPLTILELPDEVPARLTGIAWHAERKPSPAATAFVETARAVCAELAIPEARAAV